MSNFEDQLWSQLVRERGEQMRAAPRATSALASSVTADRATALRVPRLRRPALVTGSALGIAGLATAGVFALSSAPPAFAVTKNPDGTVAITLSDLSDLPALNQKLAQDGIPFTAVPMRASCSTSEPVTMMPGVPAGTEPTSAAIIIDPSLITTGDVGVLGATQTASGRVAMVAGEVTPPAPSCLNNAAFTKPIHRAGGANIARSYKTRIDRKYARHANRRAPSR